MAGGCGWRLLPCNTPTYVRVHIHACMYMYVCMHVCPHLLTHSLTHSIHVLTQSITHSRLATFYRQENCNFLVVLHAVRSEEELHSFNIRREEFILLTVLLYMSENLLRRHPPRQMQCIRGFTHVTLSSHIQVPQYPQSVSSSELEQYDKPHPSIICACALLIFSTPNPGHAPDGVITIGATGSGCPMALLGRTATWLLLFY